MSSRHCLLRFRAASLRLRVPSTLPLHVLLLALFLTAPGMAAVLRVDSRAPGPGHNGTSWPAAFLTIGQAIGAAAPGDEVWVAAGTYRERLVLRDGVSLYGGFAGTETDRSGRDPRRHKTVLDGHKAGPVVTAPASVTPRTVQDGFTITNGVPGVEVAYSGGGILCRGGSPVIANNLIRDNQAIYGAGAAVTDGGAPVFDSNTFRGNGSPWPGTGLVPYGGGIHVRAASAEIRNNVFDGNTALIGAAVYASYAPVIRFVGNTAVRNVAGVSTTDFDAAVQVSGVEITVANNLVAFNDKGLAAWTNGGSLVIRGNNVFGNREGNYIYSPLSNNPLGGNGNVSRDPRLEPDGIHLRPDSSCVDAGDEMFPLPGEADVDGDPRVRGRRVDIGADESPYTAPESSYRIVRVRPDGSDAHDGASWVAAKRTVQAALDAIPPRARGEVWVATGRYTGGILLPAWAGLYGGFAGTETAREQREPRRFSTALAGVAVARGAGPDTVLDGFTLRSLLVPAGSPVIRGNIIRDAGSTALSVVDGGSAVIEYNTFVANRGTAVEIRDASPRVANNLIVQNGSGIYCTGTAAPDIVNNTIVGHATGRGIILNGNTAPRLVNNIIAFNAQGVFSYGSANTRPVFYNNNVYGNEYANFEYTDDPTGTNGNISADPLFAAIRLGNYHIQPASPCRDAGTTSVVNVGDTDIDGQPRVIGASVDIGVDESDLRFWRPRPPAPIRVKPDGDDTRDGSSWAAAKRTIQAAVDAASATPGAEVWVAAGVYRERVDLKPFAYVYGGFRGDEARRDERDVSRSVTIIDAEERGTIISVEVGGNVSRLDGFTLRNPGRDISWGGLYAIRSSAPSTFANNTVIGEVITVYPDTLLQQNRIYGSVEAGSATLDGNTVTDDWASRGAVRVREGAILRNNVVIGCGGDGVLVESGPVLLVNNTVVGNSRAGIVIESGEATLVNNIVAFNGGGILARESYNYPEPDPTLVARSNVIHGNADYAVMGFPDPIGVNGNVAVDPRLAGFRQGNAHIQPDSPARDAGDQSVVEPGDVDIDGQPRVQGVGVDIGADESDGTSWTVLPRIVRVSPNGSDASDGSTWTSAKQSVQAAVREAPGGEVWVAAGLYHERLSFRDVALYGGFAGHETDRAQRDPRRHPTVLNGGAGGSVVLVGADSPETTVIDGFTILNGSANRGGGIEIAYGARPVISGNLITENGAIRGGGIMVESGADPLIIRNVITRNGAPGGGGIEFWTDARGTVKNNLIYGNQANFGPGLFHTEGPGSVLIANNTILDGVAIWTLNDVVVNNLLGVETAGGTWRNNGILFGTVPPGNAPMDPLFVNPAVGHYRLRPGSPAIDAGDSSVVSPGETDLDGGPRIRGALVDLGAYEFVPSPVYTMADVAAALLASGGFRSLDAAQAARLDVAGGASGRIDLPDAASLARKVAGLDP